MNPAQMQQQQMAMMAQQQQAAQAQAAAPNAAAATSGVNPAVQAAAAAQAQQQKPAVPQPAVSASAGAPPPVAAPVASSGAPPTPAAAGGQQLSAAASTPTSDPTLQALPIRAYLDQTVVPILLDGTFRFTHVVDELDRMYGTLALSSYPDKSTYHFQSSFVSLLFSLMNCLLCDLEMNTTGMAEVVKVRPENPIEFLAGYLLRNDPQKVGTAPAPAAGK